MPLSISGLLVEEELTRKLEETEYKRQYLKPGMHIEVSLKPAGRSGTKSTLVTDVPWMGLLHVGTEAILVKSLIVTPLTGKDIGRLFACEEMSRLVFAEENF